MTEATGVGRLGLLACEEGCDPIEDRLRATLRSTIEAVFDEELAAFLARLKDSRAFRLRGRVTTMDGGSASLPPPWVPRG